MAYWNGLDTDPFPINTNGEITSDIIWHVMDCAAEKSIFVAVISMFGAEDLATA